MDDLASRSQDKLLTFRLTELKDVLGRIGMTKQGKKQVLVNRIMNLLAPSDLQGSKSNGCGGKKIAAGREEVAKIIDDIFRKMKGCGAKDLASKGQNMPKSLSTVDEDEYGEICVTEAKTRCPCGSSVDCDVMIQCDDNKCKVWQHLACVVIPEKAGEGVQAEVPTLFYCEACRINRADPFCVTVSQPVLPTKLTTSFVSGEGSSPLQNIEKTFILSRMDRDLLQKPGYDLQVWCILLNDVVMFRMHWPQYADLRVNGVAVRVTNRLGPQLLGANGRDDGPGIIACSREGTNRISLSAYDARQFCLGVRIIRHQSVQQVLSLVPSETEGEPFEEGLARVRRCIGGGCCLGNADDSDNDLEVVADFITVNLRCPMSGLRMNVAGRFKYCEHMGCFDLQTFIELNEHTRKWQCPICLRNYSLENIVIDQYFSSIASVMKGYPEDVTEVEVKPDGSWHPKHEGEAKYREKWYLPDGSFPILNEDAKSKPQTSKLVKQEDRLAEVHMALKIGMKRNHDGVWELNGANNNVTSSNTFNKNKKQKSKKFLQCDSATANNRNREDPSVNQEASENLDILVDNDPDFDSASLGLVLPLSSVVKHVTSELQKECELIVLSDSEEEFEDELNIGSSAASALAGSDNPAQGGFDRKKSSENLPEEPLICNSIPFVPSNSPTLNTVPFSANGPLDLFGVDAFEFDPPHWSPKSQNSPFQLFGTDTSAPESTANSQHISVVKPTSVTRYNVAPQERIRKSSVSRSPDYSRSPDSAQNCSNTEVNGTPIENLSSIDFGDASLQLFLSPQPDPTSVQDDTSEPIVSSDTFQANWISLSVGNDNVTGTHTQETFITKRQQTADQRCGLDSLENTALNVNTNGTLLGSFDYRGSESPLQHQQPRSVHS